VTGFFFNPNIHPLLEWRRRATGVRDVAEYTKMEVIEDAVYDPAAWFATVVPGQDGRCRRCIGQRLLRTAEAAAARGCSAFSTTLSISPYQDHEAIRSAGEDAARLHDVEFLYEDLRLHYPESRRLSREWGIYRQKYCGCLVSEWERYRGS
jgi:predicted adenine nucleotide alpha hydrolase (AANH) superfamily ATPase